MAKAPTMFDSDWDLHFVATLPDGSPRNLIVGTGTRGEVLRRYIILVPP